MTPSKYAKSLGLPSMIEVARITELPRSTLYDWAEDKPEALRVLITGAAVIYREQNGDKNSNATG